MADESWMPSWLRCASCQRRAVEAAVATKEAAVATREATASAVATTTAAAVKAISKAPVCPLSKLSGDCHLTRAYAKAASSRSHALAEPKDEEGRLKAEKIAKVLYKGSELAGETAFTYAEVAFDGAIELDPLDWRGYYGKAVVLSLQGKYFKAFQTCRRGCEKMPKSLMMKELEEASREAYKQSKVDVAAENAAAKEALKAAPASASDCPGGLVPDVAVPEPVVSRPFSGRLATAEERKAKKDMMLGIFREQWERIGKTKETMGFNDYSKEQAAGLKIAGGHQPMPRPKDAVIPKGFREPIGTIDAEHLGQTYHCACERLLISLHGNIYDVSDRPDKYGKDAPYYYFAGRDITWGLVTGDDSEERTNMFFDLFKMEDSELNKKMQCLCSWTGFYEVEYGKPVGRLAEFEAEHELPAPPEHKDECVVQ